jgi:hypothetical protein
VGLLLTAVAVGVDGTTVSVALSAKPGVDVKLGNG